jgi:Mg-chelatase subunit ChlD
MFPSSLEKKEEDKKADISKLSQIEELSGKLRFENIDEKLMHSVLENDSEKIEEGLVIQESLNRGVGSFTPDLLFEKLVKNFRLTKSLFGEALIRAVSGYDPEYLEKNIGIPEFQRELKKKIKEKLQRFKKDGIINSDGLVTEKGIELASLVLCIQELDNILPKGIRGERFHKKRHVYGDKREVKDYRKGDRYKDIAIKSSVKLALRRGHSELSMTDLKIHEKESKGEVYLIYALDSSGSMKGDKISMCKKAGVALAYQAIESKDRVGLIVFGTEVREAIAPTRDFSLLLKSITKIKAAAETDIAATITKSIELFPNINATRHLLLLSDALPTKGDDPEKAALEAASAARSKGITISVVGINLDSRGKKIAEKLVEIGGGRLYTVRDLKEIGKLVLEDYHSIL